MDCAVIVLSHCKLFYLVQHYFVFYFNRIVDMDVPRGCIKITNPKTRHGEQPREFTYDAIYDWK